MPNQESYTKLFASITASTVWGESSDTRVVWVTMLAMADQYGRISASMPGLARLANVSQKACETALRKFLSPDIHSRTPDHEGRRIEVIDGGWRLLNHAKYRNLVDEEHRRAKDAERQRRHRANVALSEKSSNGSGHGDVTESHDIADTDTDTSTDNSSGNGKSSGSTEPKEQEGRAKRDMTFDQFRDRCKKLGEPAIPKAHAVFTYADKIKLPNDFIRLAWREFAARHEGGLKRQAGVKGWRQAFSNCVRSNWYRLWFQDERHEWALTTTGKQAQIAHPVERQTKSGDGQPGAHA